jgi:hypothetical protein
MVGLAFDERAATAAKQRMSAGRPKEGKARLPDDPGRARDKAAAQVGVLIVSLLGLILWRIW